MDYSSFLEQFNEDSIDETNDFVAGISCTPMSSVDLRRLNGEAVGSEEIHETMATREALRAEVRAYQN